MLAVKLSRDSLCLLLSVLGAVLAIRSSGNFGKSVGVG